MGKAVSAGENFCPLDGKSSLSVQVLDTSYHTAGHVSYFVAGNDLSSPLLFPGDSIFVGGCGRFFEGDARDCYQALYEVIRNLPPDTQIYSGHEYTASNLAFALNLEPENEALLKKAKWVLAQLEKGFPRYLPH